MYTATCDHPLHQKRHHSQIAAMGYVNPGIRGSVVSFRCPTGLELVGPNTTICMRNGEWEPGPMETDCIGYCIYNVMMVW